MIPNIRFRKNERLLLITESVYLKTEFHIIKELSIGKF